jgi:ParB family chromosome partitioning protein
MSAKADKILEQFGANISRAVAQRPGQASPPAAAPPDKYAGATRSRMFAEMPVDAIITDPQARTEFDPQDLERLAASIQRFGQLAPIRVRRDEARGAWVVLVGERRLRACRLAGLERVRVEFVERAMNEADVLAEQVVENAVRADLLPVEQGRAYQRLMALNDWTAQQLADNLGVEVTSVYRALGLLKLPDDVAAQVDAGAIKPTAAYEISKLQNADDQRAVAEQVASGVLDLKATTTEVARRRRIKSDRSKGRGRLQAERKFRGARGVKVTVQSNARHTTADIAADLREIADRLEDEASAAA